MKQPKSVMPAMALAAALWGLTLIPFIVAESLGWLPEKMAVLAWMATTWAVIALFLAYWFGLRER